ncbi:MAG: exodeoxyribonuclease VII large subunit, partial [Bacteroidales bacterium]|nr:exodeoxyribonuclease VII large subunit [Bacteroidales bacterium]
LFYVSVQIHAVHGLALRVHDIDPSYTLGLMALEKQQVLEKLKHEGVFNLNRKLHLALLPSRLAVISVETSKGYHDFLNIIRADKRNFSIYPKLFPAILQGENAVRSILSQFQAIEENQSEFDLVLIIRGGGGDIGLNCYDNYQLASRIASFPLPVITGIGHSTNETITEMVAWANKITPTDVAYFLINRFATFESGLNRLSQRLVSLTNERLRYLKKDLDYLAQRLALSSGNELRFQNDCLDRLKNGLAKYSEEYIKSQISRLEVDKMRLDLLDPILVIKRGFTITLKNGIPIASVSDIEVGDEIESRTVDGVLFSTINNVKPLEP